MKYRKRPIEVDVFLYTNQTTLGELAGFMGIEQVANFHPEYLEIVTLEGIMKASPGDYIVKGIRGEFYPCKPEIFEQTYEKVGQ